ncbi:zinc finger, CCHC-type containing protein [Tanacetum coccineum]
MVAAVMKHMASNFAKLDKFEGIDFRRWQKKMHFLLSSMRVVYVLITILEDGGDDLTMEQVRKRAKWDNDDYVCRGLILKDFKHTLKHKKEELTLVELGSHMRIGDSLKAGWLNIVNNIGKSAFMSTFKLNVSITWYVRLGNVHFNNNMQDMSKDGLILVLTWTLKIYLCDLNVIPLLGNKKYFMTFIDDASRTDRGGEYMDTLYFQSVVIIYETTAPYSGLSQEFWGEAMAVVRLPDPKLKTLGERCVECIFIGYVDHFKTFRFYVIEPNDSVSVNSIIESRDVIFDENRFSSVPRPSLKIPNETEDIGGSVVPEDVTEEDDPKTFDEAIKWKEAINDEMDSIMGNNTWVLADLPPGCKPLGCKWIFKIKLKVDGTIKKFNARLIIQGFKQKSGIEYFDTYALVARISTIRLLTAMASIHNLIIHQMDMKTAFLNDDLEEEVYMNQPQGFIILGNENKVDLTKEFLSSMFFMKDMGEADVILGIRIKHESNGITISQSHYIKNVLKKFNYFDCTPVSTSLDTSEKLMPNNGQTVSQLEYSRVIGCLMYAMTCIRPDIAFAVGKLSRYTSNPGTQHWQVIQRVLKYLKKTMNYRLTYTGYPLVLEGYTDASWISNTEDNSSTSGWVFLLGGGAISWAFKKQTCITGSTMESEFAALAAAGKEAEWLKNLLLEIPLWSKPIASISIRCDSAATFAKAYSQVYNGKSRHLGVRHSMIRELITNGVISIEFMRSQHNLADHLTKGLARDLVIKFAEWMGLKSN